MGVFQNDTRWIGCLYLFFHYLRWGGFSGVHFSTVIGNVLHRVKILEKTGLVQFENENHVSLLMSYLLLKGIIQSGKKSMGALRSKEGLSVKFKDNTWDWFLQALNDPTELFVTKHCWSGALSLLMGCIAIKILFAGFIRGVKIQNNFQLLSLKLGRSC